MDRLITPRHGRRGGSSSRSKSNSWLEEECRCSLLPSTDRDARCETGSGPSTALIYCTVRRYQKLWPAKSTAVLAKLIIRHIRSRRAWRGAARMRSGSRFSIWYGRPLWPLTSETCADRTASSSRSAIRSSGQQKMAPSGRSTGLPTLVVSASICMRPLLRTAENRRRHHSTTSPSRRRTAEA